jgi:hypothetical protein
MFVIIDWFIMAWIARWLKPVQFRIEFRIYPLKRAADTSVKAT